MAQYNTGPPIALLSGFSGVSGADYSLTLGEPYAALPIGHDRILSFVGVTICSHLDMELVFRNLLNESHRSGARPFHHHNEEHSAFVPSADPAHPPGIDSVTYGCRPKQAQELGVNLRGQLRTALTSCLLPPPIH
jgi:hypothetical protein